jgi:hypothetical protein
VVGLRALRGRRLAILATIGLLAVAVVSATALSSTPPSSDAEYGVSCLAVGAWVPSDDESDGDSLARFAAAADDLGPLTMRRSFDSDLPRSFAASAAAGDAAAGLHSFVSWKPPGGDHRGAAAGRYDREIARWARSVPTTGVFATAFHEPENDMTAEDFVAFQRHVYRVVKDANPTIHWGPVYMAYWWDPAEPGHYVGDPGAWWPGAGFADFVGLDWYGAEPEPMTASPSFLHWYEFMAPTGLPLVIAEYGQAVVREGAQPDSDRQSARAQAIVQDSRWIARHPRVIAWLYWHGPGPRGDWRLTDHASQLAWRAAGSGACRP